MGIAVADLDASVTVFSRLLGKATYTTEILPEAGVQVAFFQVGEIKIELLAPLSTDSVLHRFLSTSGQGLHHLAFGVDDLLASRDALKSKGFQPLSELPQKGANNKQVCFFHPKQTEGVLIELCQPAPEEER